MKKYLLLFILILLSLSGCSQKTVKTAAQQTSTNLSEEKPLEQKKEPIPEPVREPIVTTAKLSVVGDIMVHSYQYEEAYQKEAGIYDFSHNFQDMKRYFDQADFVIGNFETVLAGDEAGISDYPCFNTPDSFLDTVKNAGFDLLTTANNHCYDKSEAGLLRTIQMLDDKNIEHVGTYASPEKRDEIKIMDINGIKIAFLSYTYGTNGIPVKQSYQVNLLEEEIVIDDLKRAKALKPDLIVVMPHMGIEYQSYSNETTKKWADLMFQNGADIILSKSPSCAATNGVP